MKTIFIILCGLSGLVQSCKKRDYGNGGHVCVCTSTYCDEIQKPTLLEPPFYLIYTTNKAGLRFHQTNSSFSQKQKKHKNEIQIHLNEKFQKIFGFGGAFTDATGINIASVEKATQDKLLQSYFSDNGIEYNLCRVPIGGTDFSTHAYSYDDVEPDPELKNFQLTQEDFRYKIPFIKKAQKLRNNINFFASAWTAPKWMKTNNQFNGLFGFLRLEMYQSWADYFVKFLDKYKEYGINFWGITTGNEPSLGFIPFNKINSIAWTTKAMGKWIKNNLGPTIRNSNHTNIKILILDDQRFLLPWFVDQALEEGTTRNYIDGIAIHWYQDFLFPANLLTETHQRYPDKFLLATEACNGDKPFQKKVDLGSWTRGEWYVEDIIQDLLHWVTGWVDWNMALNLQGGPTYIKNFVDSPIIVNATAGEFYKQPTFYTLGHFSKFISDGSIRIGSSGFSEKVPVVAFLRPDNTTVVIILNKLEESVSVSLVDSYRGSTLINLTEKSITTVLYK